MTLGHRQSFSIFRRARRNWPFSHRQVKEKFVEPSKVKGYLTFFYAHYFLIYAIYYFFNELRSFFLLLRGVLGSTLELVFFSSMLEFDTAMNFLEDFTGWLGWGQSPLFQFFIIILFPIRKLVSKKYIIFHLLLQIVHFKSENSIKEVHEFWSFSQFRNSWLLFEMFFSEIDKIMAVLDKNRGWMIDFW
jgi:hypothetical protein